MADHFLSNYTDEIESHASIGGENLQVMQDLANSIINDSTNNLECQFDVVHEAIEKKKKNVEMKLAANDMYSKFKSVSHQVHEKEMTIKTLEKQLQQKQEEYKNFKSEQKKQKCEMTITLNALQKGIKYFTKYFQYTIDTEDLKDENKYSVVIKFVTDKNKSKHPIKFIFDRKTDNLLGIFNYFCVDNNVFCVLDFQANDLLSKEEYETLLSCYRQSGNTIALFCALREITLVREK
ncbi:hypothetical protein FQA39_LY11797 [Lamprigera yunnana]|nr:hypothetical protein FQA39_LY11797 [Lamprigera yunnana]